jgi:hypothetical protein
MKSVWEEIAVRNKFEQSNVCFFEKIEKIEKFEKVSKQKCQQSDLIHVTKG